MSNVLTVEDLEYRCADPGFKLGPISLEIARGESIAIIGENQTGKSLLAKLLVGAIEPHGGRISLHCHDGKTGPRDQSIRMMFQFSSHALNPALSVAKILEEPLLRNTDMDKVSREQLIEETLLKVGLLREHAYHYRHMLSDGQQQRIALARAIILSPNVLVADEPFAALDPSIRSQTVNLLLKLQKEMGLSFVFISHNLGIVRHIADKILVMDKGQIIESGKTDTVFKWPQHDITKRLIMSHQSLVPQQTL
ncbi:ATP-binding cassette domain-containing protein [Alteromonas sediminis]|uniref:ATP-binding cassette domain-containing protein n=1 Tax=Alteromonas sediminis TaxID=2259342 RepID=A0A3N5Z7Z2_9ALTE|nr:ATP-binding cassette domain-containing protein [Alteromonas sediminis]RPJ65038.1 ATP-binding cassette domain-containing protein [Alteromonas sediminis]